MADTKLISPGIPNYTLRRNLILDGNYISNDGGDEGISIDNDGIVTASSQIDIGNMSLTTSEIDISSGDLTIDVASDLIVDAEDDIRLDFGDGDELLIKENGSTLAKFVDLLGCEFTLYESPGGSDTFIIYTSANGATQITTSDGAGTNAPLTCQIDGYIIMKSYGFGATVAEASGKAITLAPGTKVLIDKNLSETTASTITALHVDLDRTGTVSSGSDTTYGIDIDVDHTGASGGTITSYGIALTVVGDTGTAYGMNMHISGSDTCNGIVLNNKDGGTDFFNASSAQANDYFTLNTIEDGETTLTTVENGVGSTAHLNMVADGNFTVDAAGNISLDAAGHVEFDGCGVGFDLETPTYNASDTDVNFINGNKQFVTFDGGDIADLNLIFPKVSGNFLLMLKQDGTGGRTVTNYKVWDRVDSSAGSGSATVKFAGGSNPDLTDDANHVDIVSFFYDSDNEIAYGVATLDFQF